jgi:hypothetical protein
MFEYAPDGLPGDRSSSSSTAERTAVAIEAAGWNTLADENAFS